MLTCHGAILEYRGWKKAVEMLFNNSVGRWTLRSADRVIALTPTQADLVRGWAPAREDSRDPGPA